MAKKLSTQAQLQLSVTQALEKIKKLSAELKAIKEQTSQPLKVDVQLDLTKFNQQADQIKKILGGTRNSKGQFSTIASEVRAIRAELTKLNTSIKTIGESLGMVGKTGEQVSKNINRSLSGNNQQITGLVNNVEQFNVTLRKSSEEADNFKNKSSGAFSAAMTGLSSLVSGANQAYAAFRSVGTGFLSTLGNIANKAMDTVGFSVNGMVDEAMEQERKLQQSAIGFRNMFPNQDPNSAIKLVRKTAAESPGLNSGDLADYINQLGAVAGGSFDTAYNATLGILKTVQYGGGDAASQMNYIIKNVRDVMAKGKATQVDIQQFNRAMPLLAKAMDAIGASEFLKDGQLTITKDNASKLMEAFANLNTPDNPAYGIYADTAKTLAGIQEEFREATASTIAEGLENIGFFDALSGIMRKTVLPEIQGDIKTFFQWISEIAGDIDWKEVQKTVGEVVKEIKGLIGELANYLKDNVLNTDGIKLAIRVVGEFIKGLISGAKTLAEWLNNLKNHLGEEGLMTIAKSLGEVVTRGWMVSKVLSVLAGGLETFSHVAQASFFFSRNFSFGGAGAAGTGAGTNTIASKLGGAVAKVGGGGTLMKEAATSKIGSAMSFAGKAIGRLGIAGLITGLGEAAGNATMGLNLFGEQSDLVGEGLKVVTKTISGVVLGSLLGIPGMIAAGVTSFVFAMKQAEQELQQKKADETSEAIIKKKPGDAEDILNRAIEAYRTKGGVIDLNTDDGVWAYNQVVDWLQTIPEADWKDDEVLSKLATAVRQKTLHSLMVGVDEEEGFRNATGEKVDFITKDEHGVTHISKEGEELANLIKKYNMVGWEDVEALQNATPETLLREYLNGNELNSGQFEYLKNRASEFEKQVAEVTTDVRDEITTAISTAGGNIDTAIKNAEKAGDDALAATLRLYKGIEAKWSSAMFMMGLEIGDNPTINDDVAKEFLGEELSAKNDRVKNNLGAWDGFWGNFNGDNSKRAPLNNLLNEGWGTTDLRRVTTDMQQRRINLLMELNNASTSEDRKNKIQQEVDNIESALSAYKNTGDDDYSGMAQAFKDYIQHGVEQFVANYDYAKRQPGSYDFGWLPTKQQPSAELMSNLEDDLGWANYLGNLLYWLKKLDIPNAPTSLPYHDYNPSVGNRNYANGGEVSPIFRAGGGKGGRGVDIVPAFLQPGEFVQRKTAVETAGLSVMQALNNGDLASAYKLIGSKINGHWNQSRNDYSSRDNRHYQSNNFFIRNYNRSGRAGTKTSLANHLALGY